MGTAVAPLPLLAAVGPQPRSGVGAALLLHTIEPGADPFEPVLHAPGEHLADFAPVAVFLELRMIHVMQPPKRARARRTPSRRA